ncbi:MAG TPA: hypothetical protein VGE97_08915 [Nitrososphaera sp.]
MGLGRFVGDYTETRFRALNHIIPDLNLPAGGVNHGHDVTEPGHPGFTIQPTIDAA